MQNFNKLLQKAAVARKKKMLEGTTTLSQKRFLPTLHAVLKQKYILLNYVWQLMFA